MTCSDDSRNRCTGCVTYRQYFNNELIPCSSEVYNSEGQCPCSNCIIKCMCQNACPDYHKFRTSVTRVKMRKRLNHEL